MVWARTRNGYYEHGFLSQKDTHFNVYFYPKGEIKHSVKDNTSVILDKKPDEKKIRVGLNVIFANAEKGKFEPGRIKQLWEKKDGGRVVESGWEDVEKGIDKAQYLVKSYMDGKEYWKSSSGIRLMPRLNVDGKLCFHQHLIQLFIAMFVIEFLARMLRKPFLTYSRGWIKTN